MGTDGLSAEQVLTRTYHLLQGWERCAYLFADLYWIDLQRPEVRRMSGCQWRDAAELLVLPCKWIEQAYRPWTKRIEKTFKSERQVLHSYWRMEMFRSDVRDNALLFEKPTYDRTMEPLVGWVVLLETWRDEIDSTINQVESSSSAEKHAFSGRHQLRRELERALADLQQMPIQSAQREQGLTLASLRWAVTRLLDPSLDEAASLRQTFKLLLKQITELAGWDGDYTPILEGRRPLIPKPAA